MPREPHYIASLQKLTDQQLAERAYDITIDAATMGMPDSFLRATFSAIADEVKRRIGNTAPTTGEDIS